MTPVTSPGAVEALSALLFGDAVDGAAIAKMMPGPSDVHIPGGNMKLRGYPMQKAPGATRVVRKDLSPEQRRSQRVDQAGAVIGGISTGIGVKEVVHGGMKLRAARAPRVLSGKGRALRSIMPAGKIAGGGVLIAGDVLGTMALKQRSENVNKATIGELVQGLKVRARRTTSTLSNQQITNSVPVKVAGAVRGGAEQGGKAVAAGAKQLNQTGQGQAMMVGAAVAGGAAGHRHRQQRRSMAMSQQGMGMAPQVGYAKADLEISGTFSKLDPEKKRAYGWASVVTMNGMPVIDRQGDYIALDDMEEAAYSYVQKSRVTGDMHRRTHDDKPHQIGELIESVVFTKEKCDAMGVPASLAGRWWMGVQIVDDEDWETVKTGRSGFSIHGRGIRKDVAYDDVMSGRA